MNISDNGWSGETPSRLALAASDAQTAAERLATLRAASLTELTGLATELYVDIAQLRDNAFSDTPVSRHGLQNVVSRLDRLAERLAQASRGYAAAQPNDVLYFGVLADLSQHGWIERDPRELDGVLPPVMITDVRQIRGDLRGWRRGGREISLWFTGPYALAYAYDNIRGPLWSADELRASITSGDDEAAASWPAPWGSGGATPFGAAYVEICAAFTRSGWGNPVAAWRCDWSGVTRANGEGFVSQWRAPDGSGFAVNVLCLEGIPAAVWHWRGRVEQFADLLRLITRS